MHRRDVLQLLSGWALARALEPFVPHRAPPVLHLLVVSPPNQTPSIIARDLGVALGVDEARHAATMFGGDMQATTVIVRSPDDLQRDARRVKATALIGGEDLSTCLALADVARELGALHFNVSCTADALRDADCRRHSFHICPSDAMLRDTRTQLKMPLDARVTAWDPALDRFGADTLNRRFEARFRRPMTADAWCGWFAAKVLWEGALRARSTDAQGLTTYLESDTASFDGHKGRPLSFRAWDHQLRQPVYLMGGSTGVGILEAPASAGPEEASRDMLDRIGTPAARTTCRWTGQ